MAHEGDLLQKALSLLGILKCVKGVCETEMFSLLRGSEPPWYPIDSKIFSTQETIYIFVSDNLEWNWYDIFWVNEAENVFTF